MSLCPNCGTQLTSDAAVCFICGTALEREAESAGERLCPACGKRYPAGYTDTFCSCGAELAARPTAPATVQRPAAGTCCLVLYGANRQPLRYFPVTKDVTLIGRLDAVQGCFPDIDIDSCVDAGTARKVSRMHALVLHSRADNTFRLRPLGGNTGTQIEADMVLPLHDYVLTPGTRFILGGGVRF